MLVSSVFQGRLSRTLVAGTPGLRGLTAPGGTFRLAGWADHARTICRMKPLHIAASLRIVSKHLHVRKVSIMAARDAIQRAAKAPVYGPMVDELEQATGMPIAELAELTKKWLPKG